MMRSVWERRVVRESGIHKYHHRKLPRTPSGNPSQNTFKPSLIACLSFLHTNPNLQMTLPPSHKQNRMMLLSPSKSRNLVSIAREMGTERSFASARGETGSVRESGVTRTGTALSVVCLSLGELHLRGRDVFPLGVCVVTKVVVALIDVLLLVIDTRVGDVIVSLPGVLLLVDSTGMGDVTEALMDVTGGLVVTVEVMVALIEALSLRGLSDHVFPFVVAVLLR